MTLTRFITPFSTALDTAGVTLPGAKLYFYISGTATPQNTYSDDALTIPNTNPVVSDAAGLFSNIYLIDGAEYKVILTDQDGNQVWTADPVESGVEQAAVSSTIANIAALRASAVTNSLVNLLVYVRGYYTDNDGGEGFFQVANTPPGADNGGTIIWSNTTGYYFTRQDLGFINAKWFGAKGDATTNDYTALFNAVAATRTLGLGQSTMYVPSGIYMLSNQLDISGISVIGAGNVETIFQRNATSVDPYTITLNSSTYGGGAANQYYANFQISGNQAGNANANWALGLIGNAILNTFVNIFIQHAKTLALRFVSGVDGVPNANTFIRLSIQNCPCDAIELRCGESNKFIGLDVEGIIGRFMWISGADAAVGPLSIDTFFFENNGDTALSAVMIEGGSGQIEFKYGSCRSYGKHDGSAGTGFNLSACSQVVLEGLTITPFAGSSGANHWKISVGTFAGSCQFRNMSQLTYADVADSSGTCTYTNCGYLGVAMVWVWNTAAMLPGETWYFSPGCPVGTKGASGASVRGRLDGIQPVVAMYAETSHVIAGTDQIPIDLMKDTTTSGLACVLTNVTGAEYSQFSVSLTHANTFTVRMINTSATDTIAIGTVGVALSFQK